MLRRKPTRIELKPDDIEEFDQYMKEKAAMAADIREIYAEAKSNGFEPKIMRQVIKLRKMDRDDRQEQEAVLSLYLEALGEATPGSA